MTQRTKLNFELNQPISVELLFDEPVSGTNQYGEYHLYAVKSGETEYSFFPTEEVHKELKNLKKGDIAVITKTAKQNGKKLISEFIVDTVKKEEIRNENSKKEEMPNQQQSEKSKHDTFFNVMLNSYRDAIEIQQLLGGLPDASKIAVTLFIARSKVAA